MSDEKTSGPRDVAGRPIAAVPGRGSVAAEESHSDLVAERRREAALRATAEAALRRARRETLPDHAQAPIEKGGRGGLDPVRYGDWEVKGIATDF
jgi:hypothetical protein